MICLRSPFTAALLIAGFAQAHGAALLSNFTTSNSDTAAANTDMNYWRVVRFTTPSYATQLQSVSTRLALSDFVNTPTVEFRTGQTTNNVGTVVHTMIRPTFIVGVQTYTFTTAGFTFQPNTTYSMTVRNATNNSVGTWYYGSPIATPAGLATYINCQVTFNGSAPFTTNALIPRFTINVADPAQTVTGNITLSDTTSPFAANRNINYDIKQGTTTVQTGTIVSSSASTPFSISLPASVTGGVVIGFDGSSFLRESRGITLTGTTTAIGATNLRNGDPDMSGEVDAVDIDIVIADFGSTSVGNSDVDVSGEVDAVDIDIVIANFGATDE